MLDLALLDGLVILYVAWRLYRGTRRELGESLHDLVALALLLGLFFGFRMAAEIRVLLSGLADWMEVVPGLGSKLLLLVLAWLLFRLLRKRTGAWIQAAVPRKTHRPLAVATEGLRAVLLAGFVLWLVEGWFEPFGEQVPRSIAGVRLVDAHVAAWVYGLGGASHAPGGPR
jgi:hypothetical protein